MLLARREDGDLPEERTRLLATVINEAGFERLLYFILQLVQQFQQAGESFMIQHKDVDLMGEVSEDLRRAVLEAIPPEERLKGIPPEERLKGLTDEELSRLRSLLERRKESE